MKWLTPAVAEALAKLLAALLGLLLALGAVAPDAAQALLGIRPFG